MVKFQGDMMTIKDKRLKILACLVILLLGMSLVPAASANSASSTIPSIPNVFEGNLNGDAVSAGPGIIISAYIDSKLVGSNPLINTGKYQVAVNGTEQDNGKAITFKLAGVPSEPVSVIYNHGAVPVKIDLTFNGDFIPPTIETLSASPKFILNEGKDFSAVRAKVIGKSSGAPSVTLDLTPIGQGMVSLKPEGGDLYSYDIKSTVPGKFKFVFTAANPSGSSAIDADSISITVLSESQLATEFGGADGVFSPEEIKSLVSNNDISSGIKYAVLGTYFANALYDAPISAGSAGRAFPATVSPGQEFQVTVNVANYGAAGQVLEKLPAGFTFVKSTLPEKAVTVNGSEVSFLLIGETSFSYTMKAPASTGGYKIVGLLRDINKAESSVTPADCSITVSQSSSGGSGGSSGGSGGSSGGSGGSGGGAGASQEPQSNVEAKELSQKSVTAGKHIKFEFAKGATCIRYVEFDAKKSLGKVTTIVEMLKGQSKLVSSLPEGTVYKNVNIWVGSGGIANSNNMENAVVGFRVEKAWLKDCGADESSLALWHYDKAWSKLETKKVGEDSTYVFFESRTPGFGSFTILVPGEKIELESSNQADTSSSNASESPESNPASDAQKPSGWRSIPGFESVIAIGVLGAVYQVLRRK
ncbi:PGF-pre-PGF domain-containing protein [Methanosarcina sp.]|uniref:PGF-pre-PGF domain-containing protein n=1 Tax=Methanosarcina sp. TaxID=2213 RepID=UPI003C756380